jgi:hypothetical protein
MITDRINFRILFFSILFLFAACEPSGKQKTELDQRKEKIEVHEQQPVSAEQKQRKEKSIKYLKSKAVDLIDHLPVIAGDAETTIRSQEEILNRAIVLSYMGLKSEGLEKELLDGFEKKYQITDQFTPEELKYKNASKPTDQQTTDANWKYEGLHVMLWSMGYIDELVYPDVLCNVGNDVKIIFSRTKEQLLSEA